MRKDKTRRRRIAKGILVSSTNKVQQGCIRCLNIVQYYDPLTYERIRRVVID